MAALKPHRRIAAVAKTVIVIKNTKVIGWSNASRMPYPTGDVK